MKDILAPKGYSSGSEKYRCYVYCFVCFTTHETTFGLNCLASLSKCIHMINEQKPLLFPIPTTPNTYINMFMCEAGAAQLAVAPTVKGSSIRTS